MKYLIDDLTTAIPNGSSMEYKIKYTNAFAKIDDPEHEDDHIHDLCEIYYNLAGDVSFFVEGKVYPIKSGDIIISRNNEIHRCIYHSDCVHECFCVWINATGKLAELLAPFFNRPIGTGNHISLTENKVSLMSENMFKLYENSMSGNSFSASAVSSMFEILNIIAENSAFSSPANYLPDTVQQITDYISLNFSEPECSVEQICKIFFISRSTLCRNFRTHFDTTPSAYIDSKRFSHAKALLDEGKSVQDACFGSGFSDCSHFISRFKAKFSVTPYKYKLNQTHK